MRTSSRRRPSLEILEDRHLLAIFGVPWPDPEHLTLSFVPDGTTIGSAPSVLFQTLNARMPTTTWQLDILRAFQSWAVLGNINIGVVADSGQPSGQPGPLQGNPGFGDLRIAAEPLSLNEVAIASPFDLLGNASGLIILNSNAPFGDGRGALENLVSAALHEAGHTLGLDDNATDPASAMNPVNQGVVTGPSAADAAALQALYGVRQLDPSEASPGHGAVTPIAVLNPLALPTSFLAATKGLGTSPSGKSAPWLVAGDIASLGDQDVYSFTAPSNSSGPLVVVVKTSGISMLTPRVTLFDADGHIIAAAVTTDPLHNDVKLTLPHETPGTRLHVQVASGQANVFGIGSYRIAVGTLPLAVLATSMPTSAGVVPSGGTNDSFDRATVFEHQTPNTDARWEDVVRGRMTPLDDTAFFSVPTGGTSQTLIAGVWGLVPGGLTPRIAVFDARHDPVAFQVLALSASADAIEIPAARSHTRYIIEVLPADRDSMHAFGNYTFGVDFRPTPITQDAIAGGSVQAARNQDLHTLSVSSTGLFHFDLSGTSANLSVDTAVRMTIYDASKRPVFSIRAEADDGSSMGDVLLGRGTYTLRVIAATRTGAALPKFTYTLRGLVRSDPIGPSPIDPTMIPSGPGSGSTDPYLTTVLPAPADLYFLSLTDPYSNPWLS